MTIVLYKVVGITDITGYENGENTFFVGLESYFNVPSCLEGKGWPSPRHLSAVFSNKQHSARILTTKLLGNTHASQTEVRYTNLCSLPPHLKQFKE